MAQDQQNKTRTTITLFSDDVELIDQLKLIFEKDTDVKMSNINVVRKALKIALRQATLISRSVATIT